MKKKSQVEYEPDILRIRNAARSILGSEFSTNYDITQSGFGGGITINKRLFASDNLTIGSTSYPLHNTPLYSEREWVWISYLHSAPGVFGRIGLTCDSLVFSIYTLEARLPGVKDNIDNKKFRHQKEEGEWEDLLAKIERDIRRGNFSAERLDL